MMKVLILLSLTSAVFASVAGASDLIACQLVASADSSVVLTPEKVINLAKAGGWPDSISYNDQSQGLSAQATLVRLPNEDNKIRTILNVRINGEVHTVVTATQDKAIDLTAGEMAPDFSDAFGAPKAGIRLICRGQ